MRLYTRHKTLRLRKSRFSWALVALVLVAWGWLVWQKRDQGKVAAKRAPPASNSNVARVSIKPPEKREIHLPLIQAQTNDAVTTSAPDQDPNQLPSRASTPGVFIPRPPRSVFEVQLALTRQAMSPGSLDGVFGPKTRLALMAFQQKENLAVTGELDVATKERLPLTTSPLTNYIVSADDVTRLRPLGKTWLEKSQQDRLDYETIQELVAEKSQSSPGLIQRLNPTIDCTNVVPGVSLAVPDADRPPVRERAAFARIHLESRTLQVFDERTNLVAHFPCSIAAFAEKRPAGELHVAVFALNPNYTFDPENFPESAEARQISGKLVLPPGPNNPVGTAWIGLDKPSYGIHGTPRPEQVGRAESHGCFRLTNWDADYFSQLAWIGMAVYVEP